MVEVVHVGLIASAAKIVSAYLGHNPVSSGEVPRLIGEVYRALVALEENASVPTPALVPVVPIKRSITPDAIFCLDDGKKFKSLKRHLAGLGMTPKEYRAKWGLPATYPMVAPNYAAVRSRLAKSIGLGRVKGTSVPKRKARKSAAT